MALSLEDSEKIDVLLKLLEENKKHVEWLKNLDYKIMYRTILLFCAIGAWWGSKPDLLPPPSECLLISLTWVITVLALGFLLRNHLRHAGLNNEFKRICAALSLDKKKIYGEEAIVDLANGFSFHFGRILYGVIILAGGISIDVYIS